MSQSKGPIVKSAERALDIVEYAAITVHPPTFSEIMHALDIPKSSLSNLLRNLVERRYLEHDGASGTYRIGSRLRELTFLPETRSLEFLVLPELKVLKEQADETVGFYVREMDYVKVISTITGGKSLTYTMKVGDLAPLYAVSAGKIALSEMTEPEMDDFLSRVVFEKFTARTITSKATLRQQVSSARREGFAYVYEEYTPGITGIAIAVRAQGKFCGAFNFAVPTARFTEERLPLFKRSLQAAALRLEQTLQNFQADRDSGFVVSRSGTLPPSS